jgi:hypothetical protein
VPRPGLGPIWPPIQLVAGGSFPGCKVAHYSQRQVYLTEDRLQTFACNKCPKYMLHCAEYGNNTRFAIQSGNTETNCNNHWLDWYTNPPFILLSAWSLAL